MKKFLPAIAVVVVLILLFGAFDNRLNVVNYRVKTDKLSENVKLALITDLHSCLYGENQSQLVKAINRFQPDAVLLCGDIFDDEYVNQNSQLLIEQIAPNYNTYYVSGNHEWWSGRMDEYFEYLKQAGVTVLRGTSDEVIIRGNNLLISGIDDTDVKSYDPSYAAAEQQLEQIGDGVNSEVYHVLLAHRPEHVRQYLDYGFDLIVSGHAHGGQARIPFLMNGLYAPNQGFFPEFAGGMYEFNNQKLIVSRGLSRENTKLPRVFNRPELVLISLSE